MPPGEASGVLVRQSADAPLRSDPGPVHGPDGLTYQAPVTFDTRGDADAFLATIRASAQEFGLTPSSRTGVQTRLASDDSLNPFGPPYNDAGGPGTG